VVCRDLQQFGSVVGPVNLIQNDTFAAEVLEKALAVFHRAPGAATNLLFLLVIGIANKY